MVVCPFIDPSDHEAFSQVPAATEIYEKLQQKYSDQLQIALLHGQQKPDQQQKIIKQLFAQKIDLLVATSIVEVGVDLPQANIMIIEGADRFGLANLHQLRGRVGRQGQASYCVLFSNSQSTEAKKRLKLFAQESDGLKLAELDLQNRGAGDLFGLEQHGLDELRFASWNNLNLIKQAQKIAQQIQKQKLDWQPLFKIKTNNKLLAAN
jgi:ATP-dependent DNA helicase RecG